MEKRPNETPDYDGATVQREMALWVKSLTLLRTYSWCMHYSYVEYSAVQSHRQLPCAVHPVLKGHCFLQYLLLLSTSALLPLRHRTSHFSLLTSRRLSLFEPHPLTCRQFPATAKVQDHRTTRHVQGLHHLLIGRLSMKDSASRTNRARLVVHSDRSLGA